MTATPEARPREAEALFNPAFIAMMLSRAAAAHQKRTERAMPLSICFIAVPIVLHGPTREAMPRKVTAKLGVWLDDHPLLRAGFRGRARAIAPHVRAGLREGIRAGVLEVSGEDIVGRPPRRRSGLRLSEESEEILKRAQFAGGWLGLAGPPAGVFALWGVRP
jgi:hypothetical protein